MIVRAAIQRRVQQQTSSLLLLCRPLLLSSSSRPSIRAYSSKSSAGSKERSFDEEFNEWLDDQEGLSVRDASHTMHTMLSSALESLYNGKFEKSINILNESLEVKTRKGLIPTDHMNDVRRDIIMARSICYTRTGKADLALSDLNSLEAEHSKDNATLDRVSWQKVEVYTENEKSEKAIAELTKLIKRNTMDKLSKIKAHRQRANLFANNQELSKSVEDATTMISLAPNIESYVFRAALYNETGQIDLALIDINKADSLGADTADFWFNRAEI
eukprot:TRINITY_DN9127_c0_g1_i1.p1 TRINITY_DN9127_c0_g1~~TRINITY_DN9127_c0_g1_i1.p1  ORF type:complete len:273 (-),score=53.99 TRINITY_DN9127_c0_g1_i1:113-931(-)